MSGIKISVLVPVYNVRRYISRCLDSLARQSGSDFEVLILNDGSTDGSGLIAENYAKNYPLIFKVFHQANAGLLITRRRLFELASNEYLLCVDSDDYVSDDLISNLRQEIINTHADMVIFDYAVKTRSLFLRPNYKEFHAYSNSKIFDRNNIDELWVRFLNGSDLNSLWRKCFRRELLDAGSSYEKISYLRIGEDLLQSIPLMRSSYKISYIRKSMYFYTVDSKSMSRAYQSDMYKSYSEIIFRMKEIFSESEYVDEINHTCLKFVLRSVLELGKIDCNLKTKQRFDFYKLIKSDPLFNDAFDNCNLDSGFILDSLHKERYQLIDFFVFLEKILNYIKSPIRNFYYS